MINFGKIFCVFFVMVFLFSSVCDARGGGSSGGGRSSGGGSSRSSSWGGSKSSTPSTSKSTTSTKTPISTSSSSRTTALSKSDINKAQYDRAAKSGKAYTNKAQATDAFKKNEAKSDKYTSKYASEPTTRPSHIPTTYTPPGSTTPVNVTYNQQYGGYGYMNGSGLFTAYIFADMATDAMMMSSMSNHGYYVGPPVTEHSSNTWIYVVGSIVVISIMCGVAWMIWSSSESQYYDR